MLFYYLWIAPHLLLTICLGMFLRRGLHSQFPFFVTYLIVETATFLASFTASLARGNPAHALHIYRLVAVWGLGVVSVASFAVIYELANQVILSRSSLGKTLRPVMRWAAAILVLLTASAAAYLKGDLDRVMHGFEILDFSTSVLQVGLLLTLFLFSRALRVSWHSLPAGIALGLGIVGCIELATAPLFAVYIHRYVSIDIVRMAGFHVCVLVWLGYLIFHEREPKFAGSPLRASELESWDREVQKMIRR